jgi:hypothetical protein
MLAGQTAEALRHAADLTADAQAVLEGKQSVDVWLQHVPTAVSAIAFGPHKDLLRLVLRVLASAPAMSASNACGGVTLAQTREAVEAEQHAAAEAAGCLLALMQHPVAALAAQTWASVRRLLEGSDADGGAGTASHLLRLLSDAQVMRHVVVHCMAAEAADRAQDVDTVLSHLLACQDVVVASSTPSPFLPVPDTSISRHVLRTWNVYCSCVPILVVA